MRYPSPLVEARLVRRYKRFFADVILQDGREVTAHLANTGKMTGCWAEGAPCRLSKSDNPKRKLAWSVEQTCIDGRWILVNTARPNRVVEEALLRGGVAGIGPFDRLEREARLPEGRADFRLDGRVWVEVKNATLTEGRIAWFPDTVTTRGAKHLDALAERVRAGDSAWVVLHVGAENVDEVRLAHHLDPGLARSAAAAAEAGVRFVAHAVRLNAVEAELAHELPLHL